MATLKQNVLSNSSFVDEPSQATSNETDLQAILQDSSLQSGNQNPLATDQPNSAFVQNLVRHFDLSTLDRLMSAALASKSDIQQLADWSKDAFYPKMLSAPHSAASKLKTRTKASNRKSSRGSEEDPRSSVSDFEELDEVLTEQSPSSTFFNCSSILSNFPSADQQALIQEESRSSHLLDNANFEPTSQSPADRTSMDGQTLNQIADFNGEDSRSSEDSFSNSKAKSSRSMASRRKSSSRLARQTGDGSAKQFSCHLCQFVTESKPDYNVHMDKHYENRCSRCGYSCRTKGRLNRHIRESHPDLASELGPGDSKRKSKRTSAAGKSVDELIRVSYRNTAKPVESDDRYAKYCDLSTGSDSTVVIAEQQAKSAIASHPTGDDQTPHKNQTASNQNSVQDDSHTRDSSSSNHQLTVSSTAGAQPNQQQQTSFALPPVKLEEEGDPASPRSTSSDDLLMSNDQSKIYRYRKYTCKQCKHVSNSKKESWEHNRVHIHKDKLLMCPNCDFNTSFKHHLEYHLRNHFKSKPYKCWKCAYSCINKSMLNSHLKSHSNFSQYRCNDCAYSTKYCHSLKLHLRKYKHKPDRVLNADGSENPYPMIDVYGTRRGPRPKKGVSSIKLVKRVLEDNDYAVVDKEKVEQIVNTLAEHNPEEGDEKLFKLMRSNEEREVRVDQQLNHIIAEQLKTNATNQQTDDCSMMNQIGSNIKSILNQQQRQAPPPPPPSSHQAKNSQNTATVKCSLARSARSSPSSVHFVKERTSSAVLTRLSNYCKSPKKAPTATDQPTSTVASEAKQAAELLSQSGQNEQKEKVQSKLLLNSLLTGAAAESGGLQGALARSLFNPSMLTSPMFGQAPLLNPTATASLLNSTNAALLAGDKVQSTSDLYPAHLLTNQLLHNHLIAQQHSKETTNNDSLLAAKNFTAQLAFNLAFNSQATNQGTVAAANSLNCILLNSLNSSQQQQQPPQQQPPQQQREWTDQLFNQLALNQGISQGLLSPNLLNASLLNQLNLLNQAQLSAPIRPSCPPMSHSAPAPPPVSVPPPPSASDSKSGLTNSMIANWQSYLSSLLLNNGKATASGQQTKSTAHKATALSACQSTPADNQLSVSTIDTVSSSIVTTSVKSTINCNQTALDEPHSNRANDHTTTASNSSQQQPDLGSVLSSIGQVFAGGQGTSCSQPSEFDLSTLLGYGMLMKMQQQIATSTQKKN